MVGLVGVPSNEFPRALDLGRQVRAFGILVVVGGSHQYLPVSAAVWRCCRPCHRTFRKLWTLGIHVFAGEVQGHMADILRDIAARTAELIYNMPEMAGAIVPRHHRPVTIMAL